MDMEWMRQINGLPVADDELKTGKIISRDSEKYRKDIERFSKSAAPTKYWQEAKDYCVWLGKISGRNFDLPTEAQWEFAARSRGQNFYYATNNGYLQLAEDWYRDTTTGNIHEYTIDEANAPGFGGEEKVGMYPPNPLGVSGMTNGRSEWVNDWYSSDYYKNSPIKNPLGPKIGTEKVQRDAIGTTMTFDRIHKPIKLKAYYPSNTFRCSIVP
jgi:hypothetical protein